MYLALKARKLNLRIKSLLTPPTVLTCGRTGMRGSLGAMLTVVVPDGFSLELSSEAGRELLCEDQANNVGPVCQKSNLSARDHASCLHFL